GEAKNKMKNAVLIASEFINMLPPAETPAHTEGYEGFYHVSGISGDETQADIDMIIRDHDMAAFTARKAYVERTASYLNEKYGENTVIADIKDSYYNMKEKIAPVMHIVDDAVKAMQDAGVEPKIVAIRGGTDGARLSYEGLPCPNLSTGGENFHSIYEYIPVRSLEKMVEVIINLCSK
ncbi:MAG: peptidase T, partial [Lachnospiraceae bacterium]|nr:peptidase T [Lachnospiraceae bacterium]